MANWRSTNERKKKYSRRGYGGMTVMDGWSVHIKITKRKVVQGGDGKRKSSY
jgi:hypothetical protein